MVKTSYFIQIQIALKHQPPFIFGIWKKWFISHAFLKDENGGFHFPSCLAAERWAHNLVSICAFFFPEALTQQQEKQSSRNGRTVSWCPSCGIRDPQSPGMVLEASNAMLSGWTLSCRGWKPWRALFGELYAQIWGLERCLRQQHREWIESNKSGDRPLQAGYTTDLHFPNARCWVPTLLPWSFMM